VNNFARDTSVAEIGGSLAAIYARQIEQTYKHALKGYAMEMSEAQAQALSKTHASLTSKRTRKSA
jgi:hypothetical protein